MADLVSREDRGGWALLTLNRPDELNALTVGVFRELRRHATGQEVPSRGWHSGTLRMLENAGHGPDAHERMTAFSTRNR